MSETETAVTDAGGTVYDDPNREAVGLEPAWVEGTGGEAGDAETLGATATAEEEPEGLDAMTKAELLDYAQQIGVSPANNNMSKEELRASVDAKLEEAPAQ